LRTGIFVTGAVILVLGLLIVVNYQGAVSAVESMFGGWAMLSEVHQERVAYLSMGWIIAVIGIIIMIPGIILKKKENSDYYEEWRPAVEEKREDESTFTYKHLEIQPKTHPEKVPPKKPKRDLRKSPTLKGIIIGIIALSIFYGATWGLTYQTFTMTTDVDAMGIKKGDLVRFDNTPFHEIQINDMIFHVDNDKVWLHKVISVDSSKIPRTLTAQSMVSGITNLVTEDQYIGKLDSVIASMGSITGVFSPPYLYYIWIIAFIVPIAVMKIRERKILKN